MADLTIVIPIYNVEEYLKECLLSLPEGVNVVLVNDGSTDGSEEICRDYVNSHANAILVNKTNGGLSDARNCGMRHVATEYVFFLDSDDRIDGESIMRALAFSLDNQLDWVQCGYAYDYGEYLLTYKFSGNSEIMTRDDVMDCLVRDGVIKNFAWGKLYRSDIARMVEFPKGKYFEDSYWQYKIIHYSNRFGLFPSRVTYYRMRNDSISGNLSFRNLDLLNGLCERLDFIVDEYPELASVAALKLWKTATVLVVMSKRNQDKELLKVYSEASAKIQKYYSELIKRGIRKQKFIYRITDWARFGHYYWLYKTCNLLVRIYNRIVPSELVIKRVAK